MAIAMDGGIVLTVTVTGVVSVWTRPSQSSATELRTYVPADGGVQSQLQVVSLVTPSGQLKVWTVAPSTLRVSCLRYPSALAAPSSVVAPSDAIRLPLVGVSTSESMTVGMYSSGAARRQVGRRAKFGNMPASQLVST